MIVNEHTWTSEGSRPAGETTTHVSIYTLHLSGPRRRYRHFVRQPDGAILEVGGSHTVLERKLLTVNQLVQEEEEGGCAENEAINEGEEKKKRAEPWAGHPSLHLHLPV